jgi:hypothetical protein
VLEPPHGEVLVAAKSYYFGVGGSTDSFRKAVTADGVMECKQVGGPVSFLVGLCAREKKGGVY